MGTDRSDSSDNILFLTGLYTRVARQLGVHPSYVSRVARGERRSDRVYRAIASELSKLRGPVLSEAEDDATIKLSKISATREVRRKLAQKLKADSRLRRLSALVYEEDKNNVTRTYRRRVPPAALSAKVASNARLFAGAVVAFDKYSSRLERSPHVLSLLDPDSVVLYSCGTTGMARRENHVPGADWSTNGHGPSTAARCIAAAVPVVVIGALDLEGTFVPSVRIAIPVRLSDNFVAGVLVLTIEITRARVDHVIELSKIAKRLCKFVENGPTDVPLKRDKSSRIQLFAEAARHVAMVLSLPQVDPSTRVALSGILAELEAAARQTLLDDGTRRRKKTNRAQPHGA
jgi:transcriptional regulator of acetoin/glycerol metabolism